MYFFFSAHLFRAHATICAKIACRAMVTKRFFKQLSESEVDMDVKRTPAAVEEFLFSRGQSLDDYFVKQTPVAETICYRNAEGEVVDLAIADAEFAEVVSSRIKELGVEIIRSQ